MPRSGYPRRATQRVLSPRPTRSLAASVRTSLGVESGCAVLHFGLLGRFLLVGLFALLCMAAQSCLLQFFLVFLADLRAFFLIELAVLVGVVLLQHFLPKFAPFFGRLGMFLDGVVGVRRATRNWTQ